MAGNYRLRGRKTDLPSSHPLSSASSHTLAFGEGTTTIIRRRRRTRSLVVFTNDESVERMIYPIFQRSNLDWKTRALSLFTQAA